MVRKTEGSTRGTGHAAQRKPPRAATSAPRTSRAPAPSSKSELVRVAVVGGGCAGLAAAWELSRVSGYEVHVFERSFRLGGKGASGRDSFGRIHEHGLHIWLGFYENAFRLMRECYAEVAAHGWGPARTEAKERLAHTSVDDAFFPEPNIGVGGLDSQNVFTVWSGFLPPAKGLPGEPLDVDSNPYSLANYLLRCLGLIKTLVQSTVSPPSQGWTPDDETNEPPSPEELVKRISACLRAGALTGVAALLQAVTLIERWVQRVDDSRKRTGQVLKVLVAIAAQLRKMLGDVVGIDEKLRWKTEMVDIVLAIAVGLIHDRVLFRRQGFDAINDMDYRAWLAKHGATRAALDSRFLAGIYELVFAYEDGDHRRPAFAAGVALRSALRMFFTYRGSMFWRMRSGMGDAVFAPLYKTMLAPRALAKEPERSVVRFHFLHTLKRVALDHADGQRYITGLEFEARGEPDLASSGLPTALDHFGCWPTDDHQLPRADTKPRTRTLEIGKDFDAVIFATGVDDFVKILRGDKKGSVGLFDELPERWSQMADKARTVATQAAEVWLDADVKSLGWQARPGMVTALQLAFDTWADMTHTLATERAWRQASGKEFSTKVGNPRSVAYFCSVLPDRAIAEKGENRTDQDLVVDTLMKMLEGDARAIWPRAFEHGLSALDRVVDPAGPLTRQRALDYVRANSVGSERYTLSPPGSISARISPLDLSVANMTIAGDWTACGLDAGCVEAAVMSGKLAAHAVTGGTPSLDSIIGFDHP